MGAINFEALDTILRKIARETQQNSVIVHPFRVAPSNKNSNQCEQKTNLDIFASKTQGTISRKLFVVHCTKFPGNYRQAPNTISEQLSTRHAINYEQFHLTPPPMLPPAVTEKYRDNSPRVAPKKKINVIARVASYKI
jgi:hypothetical protein